MQKMNRYSKTKLRQGRLPRQPQITEAPPPPREPEKKRPGVAHEEQALLFDLSERPDGRRDGVVE